MTQQEIFNRVWDWFIVKRNNPSVNENGSCLYRGPDGKKCAVGAVLPDHLYHSDMENEGLFSLLSDYPMVQEFFGIPDDKDSFLGFDMNHPTIQLLSELQSWHDELAKDQQDSGADFRGAMEKEMRQIAEMFGLSVPEKETNG